MSYILVLIGHVCGFKFQKEFNSLKPHEKMSVMENSALQRKTFSVACEVESIKYRKKYTKMNFWPWFLSSEDFSMCNLIVYSNLCFHFQIFLIHLQINEFPKCLFLYFNFFLHCFTNHKHIDPSKYVDPYIFQWQKPSQNKALVGNYVTMCVKCPQ